MPTNVALFFYERETSMLHGHKHLSLVPGGPGEVGRVLCTQMPRPQTPATDLRLRTVSTRNLLVARFLGGTLQALADSHKVATAQRVCGMKAWSLLHLWEALYEVPVAPSGPELGA